MRLSFQNSTYTPEKLFMSQHVECASPNLPRSVGGSGHFWTGSNYNEELQQQKAVNMVPNLPESVGGSGLFWTGSNYNEELEQQKAVNMVPNLPGSVGGSGLF
jgi:hypothetical protein